MLVELKAKSQVTIPKDIVSSLNLVQGDQFEVIEDNGRIILIPVIIYPEQRIIELKNEFNKIKESLANGEQPVFDSLDRLFEDLEK